MRTYIRKLNEAGVELPPNLIEKFRAYFTLVKYRSEQLPSISIGDDDKINVNGTIVSNNLKFRRLPFNFGTIEGDAIFDRNGLITLDGCPSKVLGTFQCQGNELTSLKHGPTQVRNFYYCGDNPLTSLEGLPVDTTVILMTLYEETPLLRLVGMPYLLEIIKSIINQYRNQGPSRKNIIACQKQLIDAGFGSNAAW